MDVIQDEVFKDMILLQTVLQEVIFSYDTLLII